MIKNKKMTDQKTNKKIIKTFVLDENSDRLLQKFCKNHGIFRSSGLRVLINDRLNPGAQDNVLH